MPLPSNSDVSFNWSRRAVEQREIALHRPYLRNGRAYSASKCTASVIASDVLVV